MIYDLLPEPEVFCERGGGAISKNVASAMQYDDSRIVVCSASDGSLGFGPDRVIVIPELLFRGRKKLTRHIPPAIRSPWYRRLYAPFLSRLQPGDVAWCHNQPYIAAALATTIHAAGAKLIYQSHDPHVPATALKAFRSFVPEAWTFVSDALRQRYLELFPFFRNTCVIYNGADEDLFYPMPRDPAQAAAEPVVLYVGRLHPEKGVHVLLEAMKVLADRGIAARCKVLGSTFSGGSKETPYVRSLKTISPSNVEFLGFRSVKEVAEQIRNADILCCPSIWLEAFGKVNIEAMASGIPVVASSVGGIPEIAAEGGFLLVKPDSVSDVVDALQRLIEDPELRRRIGTEGLESFRRRFTWASIARQYREVAEKVAAGLPLAS